MNPSSADLSYNPFGSSSPLFSFPTDDLSPPLGPGTRPAIFANFCIPLIATAAPAAPPRNPGVEAFPSTPNIFLINFSAGIINPIATNVYMIFVAAKSYAIEINTIYNNK